MRYTIIIVAAGSGSRFGADLPKQFCIMGDRPVLMHTIESLSKSLPQSNIILVLSHSFFEYWLNVCNEFRFHSPQLVAGGETRWQSVKNALDFIIENNPDATDAEHTILVHDGARPIVDSETVGRVISALGNEKTIGAVPVIPVTDSLRCILPDGSSRPVDRSVFRAVQTPQAFKAKYLFEAYNEPYVDTFTDDASVVEHKFGHGVIATPLGSTHNIKITNPCDIDIALLYQRHI